MAHITLVHQAALGDTVLLIPLLRALRQRYADSHLTLVTRPNLGQMLTMLGFIDAFASADDQDHSRWFSPPRDDIPNSVPSWADCDLLISAVSSGTDDWAANARLAHQQLAKGNDRPRSCIFFDPRPPENYPHHVTQWHAEQLAPLDLLPASPPPSPLPCINPDGVVVIHPGSGGDDKCWPRERFLALGHALKRNGIVPTFILGEAEQERWGNKIINDLKEQFPWYLHMGLYELAEKLSRARLFLGNDSGVTHLAAAMGIPIIALFGPSNDIQWRPIGSSVTILRPPPPNDRDLNALTEDTVLAELLAELRKFA